MLIQGKRTLSIVTCVWANYWTELVKIWQVRPNKTILQRKILKFQIKILRWNLAWISKPPSISVKIDWGEACEIFPQHCHCSCTSTADGVAYLSSLTRIIHIGCDWHCAPRNFALNLNHWKPLYLYKIVSNQYFLWYQSASTALHIFSLLITLFISSNEQRPPPSEVQAQAFPLGKFQLV